MAKHYEKLSKILQRLLFEKKMKPVDLAREVNLPQPTVHRLVTGKSTRPYRSSLEPIAKYFSLSVDELLGEKTLENEAPLFDLPEKSKQFKQIPLIDWNETETFVNTQTTSPTDSFIMVSITLSDKSFATLMPDSSMEPIFPRNSILVFDVQEEQKDRSYVLVKLKNTESPTFRQLLMDNKDKYLKPLNPDLSNFKMRILEKEDTILATLIEARTNFNVT